MDDLRNTSTELKDFDMVRTYKCKELEILEDGRLIESLVENKIYFNSQMKNCNEQRLEIKRLCNESVGNQFQYIKNLFTDTLLFRLGRQVLFTTKYINICMFFILLLF